MDSLLQQAQLALSGRKLVFWLDLDGVLVGIDKMRAPEMTDEQWDAFVWEQGHDWWATLPWTDDGVELWKAISSFYPTILTAPTRSSGCLTGKLEWVRINLGADVPVKLERDKFIYASGPHDVLIDDREKNTEAWVKAGGTAILHRSTSQTLAELEELLRVGVEATDRVDSPLPARGVRDETDRADVGDPIAPALSEPVKPQYLTHRVTPPHLKNFSPPESATARVPIGCKCGSPEQRWKWGHRRPCPGCGAMPKAPAVPESHVKCIVCGDAWRNGAPLVGNGLPVCTGCEKDIVEGKRDGDGAGVVAWGCSSRRMAGPHAMAYYTVECEMSNEAVLFAYAALADESVRKVQWIGSTVEGTSVLVVAHHQPGWDREAWVRRTARAARIAYCVTAEGNRKRTAEDVRLIEHRKVALLVDDVTIRKDARSDSNLVQVGFRDSDERQRALTYLRSLSSDQRVRFGLVVDQSFDGAVLAFRKDVSWVDMVRALLQHLALSKVIDPLPKNESSLAEFSKPGLDFEKTLLQAFDLVGLQYEKNVASGAGWDFRPVGTGWDRLVRKGAVNIKVHGAKTLFSTTGPLVSEIPWSQPGVPGFEPWEQKAAEKLVRDEISRRGLDTTLFLSPKDKGVQQQIAKLVRRKDRAGLRDLLKAGNFTALTLGKDYQIKFTFGRPDSPKFGSIVIYKGGTVFARSEAPRSKVAGGVQRVQFRMEPASVKLQQTAKVMEKLRTQALASDLSLLEQAAQALHREDAHEFPAIAPEGIRRN